MGAAGVSRRALLTRAGIGTGAGVFALIGDGRGARARGPLDHRSLERAHRVRRQAHCHQLADELGQHSEGGGAALLRPAARTSSCARAWPSRCRPTHPPRAWNVVTAGEPGVTFSAGGAVRDPRGYEHRLG